MLLSAMELSLVVSATASDFVPIDEKNSTSLLNDTTNFNPELFYEETISFHDSSSVQKFASPHVEVESRHQQNVDAAYDFVMSLGLEEKGYVLTQQACLAELEILRENEAVVLEYYTVLTPKEIPVAKSNQPADAMFFGTKNGQDFYYNYFSRTGLQTLEDRTYSNTAVIQRWMEGSINLALCFVAKEIAVPYTVITSVLGDNYIVHDDDFIKSYVRRDTVSRGIYSTAKNNPSIWRHLLTDQYAIVEPYFVYHPNVLGMDVVPTLLDRFIDKTPQFDNTSLLLDTAYSQWDFSAYGNDPFGRYIDDDDYFVRMSVT